MQDKEKNHGKLEFVRLSSLEITTPGATLGLFGISPLLLWFTFPQHANQANGHENHSVTLDVASHDQHVQSGSTKLFATESQWIFHFSAAGLDP
jgi:hypothetical protein